MVYWLKYFLYLISIVAVLAIALIAYLMWFQPPFYFPKPTGQYAVGSTEYHWIDTKRTEIYSDDPNHPHRELMVTIWYPTQEKLPEKPTTPYAPYMLNYFKQKHPLIWLLGFSRPAYIYAQPNVAIATNIQQFLVIIFSPGFRSTRNGNTAQCEELASHGYIVVGISHPYDNCVVQFPDDRIADGLQSIARRISKTEKCLEALADQDAEIWLADVHFVLDQLARLAVTKESIFYQKFDLKRIGMFGHSMGGSTAFSINDKRIRAAVNFDGAISGLIPIKTLDKPCMLLLAGNGVNMHERPLTQKEWKKYGIHSADEEKQEKATYLPLLKQLAQSSKNDFYTLVLTNAGHFDFCDLTIDKWASWIVRLAATRFDQFGLQLGSIDGLKTAQIINDYLVNFFDKYLKNKSSTLLDGQEKQYAEVEVQDWANK